MNQEVKTGVADKQTSDLLYKVWVVACLSKDGYSNQSLSCFCLCNLSKHHFTVFSTLGVEIVLVFPLSPSQKATSETRVHVQVVYFGGDSGKQC